MTNSGRRRTRSSIAGAGLAVALVAGCGSDDEQSAQEQYCAAGESLESSIGALGDLDLLAEGTDGLESRVSAIADDVNELQDASTDAAADDVSALEQSVDDLESAISDLGGEITAENVSTLATAVENVATSAQAVYATLADCP
jgi:hypothetical protein